MTKTWYVVAARTEARVLLQEGISSELETVKTFSNPEGRLQDHELGESRPGAATPGKDKTFTPTSSAHEVVAVDFCREIAKFLEHARTANSFDELVLVAEPRVLGMLREQISSECSKLIRDELHKNILSLPEHELRKHLSPVLLERERIASSS